MAGRGSWKTQLCEGPGCGERLAWGSGPDGSHAAFLNCTDWRRAGPLRVQPDRMWLCGLCRPEPHTGSAAWSNDQEGGSGPRGSSSSQSGPRSRGAGSCDQAGQSERFRGPPSLAGWPSCVRLAWGGAVGRDGGGVGGGATLVLPSHQTEEPLQRAGAGSLRQQGEA